MSANTSNVNFEKEAEKLVSKLSEEELVEIEDIVEYANFIIHHFDANNEELKHQLVVKLQREVFIIAFKEWVKDNYNKQLTNEEIETLRKEFKVKNDFEPNMIKLQGELHKTDTSITPHNILDSFISCDSIASDKLRFVDINIDDQLVFGLSQQDIKIPIKTKQYKDGRTRQYIDINDDDNIWLKILINNNKFIDSIQEQVIDIINIDLCRFSEFLNNYFEKVENTIIKAKQEQVKPLDAYNEIIDEYEETFGCGPNFITPSGIDWDIKCGLTFRNFKEALNCIDFTKAFLWRYTDFSNIEWLTHYYSRELSSLYNVVYACILRIIRKHYPDFKFAEGIVIGQDLNHQNNYC